MPRLFARLDSVNRDGIALLMPPFDLSSEAAALYGDSIRFYLTGASSHGGTQTDPDLALGNYRSATEAERVGFIVDDPISGITVSMASRYNGQSGQTGTLAAVETGTLQYTAYGSTTPGPRVAIANGETKVIPDGQDGSKWVRVTRTSASNLVGSAQIAFVGQFANLFGFADAADAERTAGSSKYRAVMLSASAAVRSVYAYVEALTSTVTTLSTYLGASGSGTIVAAAGSFSGWPHKGFVRIEDSGGTEKEIVHYTSRTGTTLTVPAAGRGLLGTSATAGAGTDIVRAVPPYRIATESPSANAIQTIANESTSPTGRTWKSGVTTAGGCSIGDLASGDMIGLWIHRHLPAGVAAFPKYEGRIQIQFEEQLTTYNETLEGLFGAAEDALARYELRLGTNAAPGLTDAAVATSATLPFTTSAATVSAGNTYYACVDRRNKWDMVSRGIDPQIFRVTSGPAKSSALPTTPTILSWTTTTAGVFTLTAWYPAFTDGADRANSFLVYTTFDGSTPTVGVTSPTVVSMAAMDPVEYFTWSSSAQGTGITGKVILAVRRTSDSADSAATSVSTVVSAAGPSGQSGRLIYRDVAEVGQA